MFSDTNTETATFETINATHLLILCPRGFINERSVYAIPAECVEDARAVAHNANPTQTDYYSRTRLVAIAEAHHLDRTAAGFILKSYKTAQDYTDSLYTLDGPLYSALDIE